MNDDVLSAGQVVGQTYEVDRVIGRGAMGQVYSAKHLRLPGLRVAIKVVTGQTLSADRLHRFRREAEIAAKLSHPNIVQIIDYNALPSGQPYLVMELLRGESLHARLKRGPLEVKTVTRLVREVGAALEAAHAAGVVHRDLKPENIFLVPTPMGDQAKVLDFGISKMADGGPVKTSDSMIIGTPRYMSPEQAMGLNSQLTSKSDVYSLATVCFEALAGKPMFDSDNVAHLLYQIAHAPPPALLVAIPNLPQNTARALEHALEKDPAQRTSDIATFVREFSGQAVSPAAPFRPVLNRAPAVTLDERPPAAAAARAGPEPQSAPASSGPSKALIAVTATALLFVSGGTAYLLSHRALNARRASSTPLSHRRLEAIDAGAAPEAERFEREKDAGPEPLAEVADARPAPSNAGARPTPKALPLSEADQLLLAELKALRAKRDWEALTGTTRRVFALPRGSAARRQGLLFVFEAACARRETNLSGTFNRIVTDYPDLRGQAQALCRAHVPEQSFDPP